MIKASGVNHDGLSSGLTVPNGAAQAALMRSVLTKAKLKGADIDYLEAHGTGTSLGDPIEVGAITEVYGERSLPLRLGAVKTNIGHIEGAAGVASVIKVILALQNEMLPRNLHFEKLNPHIQLNFPAEILIKNEAWKRDERIRRAAVSAFGFSGTNVHLILEEGPKLSEAELALLRERFKKRPEFKRKRFWAEAIDEGKKQAKEAEVAPRISLESLPEEWMYEWDWQEKSSDESVIPHPLGHWLLLSDGKVSDSLKIDFENRGATCHCISSENYPQNKEAFLRLIQAENFTGIVHLSSAGDIPPLTVENIKKAQILGTKCILDLAQALVQFQETKKIPFFLVSHNLFNTTSNSNLLYSPLNGLLKSILAEYPDLPLKHIDVGENWNPELLFTLFFMKSEERIFSLKGNQFYVPRLSRLKNRGPFENTASIKAEIKSEATYLITGGLGGLGLTLARWLSEKGAAHLVLTGRRSLNDEFKNKLKSLETENTKIHYEAIDMGDEKSVADLLKRLQQEKYPLKGIFHLAGVLDDATLMEQDWDHFEMVFRPKVYGSFYLHQYSEDLDFFVMFSSIAAAFGGAGQSNYAAANAFLDALCEYRKQIGLPGHSLSWGPWAEVGMAKDLTGRHIRGGILPLKPKEGMLALEFALASEKAQITIANIHWENFSKMRLVMPTWASAFIQRAPIQPDFILELLSATPEKRPALIEVLLIELIKTILGLQAVDASYLKKNYFEMGMDSLMAVEFKNVLQSRIKNHFILPSSFVFDYPSLADMRDYLALQLSAGAPSDEIQSKLLSQQSNQFPLTQAQARMWFLYNFESDKANYNLDAYIDLKGHLHVAFLHQAINAVIKRHEALRTTFFSEEGEVHQVIQPSLSLDLPEMDLREMRPDLQENKVAEIIQERRKLSFDLREGPLLRAVLIHLSMDHYIFGIQMHHICSDAISFNIFNKELELYYTALVNDKSSEIPPLTFQYTRLCPFTATISNN